MLLIKNLFVTNMSSAYITQNSDLHITCGNATQLVKITYFQLVSVYLFKSRRSQAYEHNALSQVLKVLEIIVPIIILCTVYYTNTCLL